MPPMAMRFLPTQEWSSGGMGIGGESANCGTRHFEIPAFAGMVFRGNGESGANRRIVAHDTVRFLPSQEWSREQESHSVVSAKS